MRLTQSRPSRARELKPDNPFGLDFDPVSRPSRARELKLAKDWKTFLGFGSRPSRARELKQGVPAGELARLVVAPLAGA